jgi:hypothetical protein
MVLVVVVVVVVGGVVAVVAVVVVVVAVVVLVLVEPDYWCFYKSKMRRSEVQCASAYWLLEECYFVEDSVTILIF